MRTCQTYLDPNRHVVLTGLEPYADFNTNPSCKAAKTFDGKEIDSFRIRSFQIPLAYKEIKPTITQIVDNQKPVVVINLGQSYRPLISLDACINFADLTESTVIYNCGTHLKDETLEPEAPAALLHNITHSRNPH